MRPAKTRHHQVQVPIAVDIAEQRTGDGQVRQRHPRRGRDVRELAAPEVPVERARTLAVDKEQVHPTILVDIPRRKPDAIHEVLRSGQSGEAQRIGEVDPQRDARDQLESSRTRLHCQGRNFHPGNVRSIQVLQA